MGREFGLEAKLDWAATPGPALRERGTASQRKGIDITMIAIAKRTMTNSHEHECENENERKLFVMLRFSIDVQRLAS